MWNFAQQKLMSLINARGLVLITCTTSEPMCTKSKGLPIDVLFYLYIFYTHNATYKKQGAPDWRPILSLYFFTRAVPHTKSNGLPIDISFYLYSFYTCNATYKKHGAPDRCPILLMSRSILVDRHSDIGSWLTFSVLFIHNQHWRMKSKGHLYINHTTHLRYPIKSFEHKFYINNVLLQNTKEKLH
jgi:hypothetical protein